VSDKTLKDRLQELQKVQAWALKSESAPRLKAMVELAQSEPGIPILHEQLDRDRWLFNCPNGTIDLRTGKLREHRREDLITKLCPTEFHPNAPCPAWERFLESIFPDEDRKPDRELIEFIQRLLGYCLTGDVSEQILAIFWGIGSNGKSTLLGTVLAVMGSDYAMRANTSLLMQGKNEHATEIAQLFGMRLVMASESEEGARLKESLIKDLTGGERLRGRRMKENFWEFDPTHKVILQTNHKPQVRGNDEGIWRRLRLVPFLARFWKADEPGAGDDIPPELMADQHLPEKLRTEAPGILAWMVRGCLAWQKGGLTLPEQVKLATQEYRAGEDLLSRWLEDCCISKAGDASFRAKSSDLYGSFRKWCEGIGEKPIGQTGWGEQMGKRYHKKVSNGVWYLGVAVRNIDSDG
jgi:putative DNA primase/helicase